jgi:hypothetical protein
MKSQTSQIVTALVAAGAFSMATAQTPATTPTPVNVTPPNGKTLSNANVPSDRPDPSAEAMRAAGRLDHDVPAVRYAPEPIASPVVKEGPEAEVEATLVQALNGEASLKGSKITVAAEKNKVTLTGVTMTKAQRKKAAEIATAQLGQENVINAILATES